jgi:uncharacterized damage-inducible protein DinB
MIEHLRRILTGQFEAALAMLHQCVRICPPEHWDSKIANDTFRQVAYHTLFFVDLYLSPGEDAFELRDLHRRGGDERSSTTASAGLDQDETLAYVAICRHKALAALAAETAESLQRDSGFARLRCSRAELHLYNIRHMQHHAGQLSASLRRIKQAVDWVKSGWRE